MTDFVRDVVNGQETITATVVANLSDETLAYLRGYADGAVSVANALNDALDEIEETPWPIAHMPHWAAS